MDELTVWIHITGILCALFIVTAIPLAVIAIRVEKKIAEKARRPVPVPVIAYRHRRIRDKFIADNVRISVFGDKRRRTAIVAEIMRPETGPIPLPNEHVAVVSQ